MTCCILNCKTQQKSESCGAYIKDIHSGKYALIAKTISSLLHEALRGRSEHSMESCLLHELVGSKIAYWGHY